MPKSRGPYAKGIARREEIFDQTVARWQPIVDAATANHDRWVSNPDR